MKKNWYIIFLSIITIGLGVVAFLTSQKLRQTTPVAPTVPQVSPKAAEPACTLTFTVAVATPTPTTPGPSPTPTPTPEPSPTPTNTPAPTATPAPVGCNNSCSNDGGCQSGLVCSAGFCRNPSCTSQSSCNCPQPTATPGTTVQSTPTGIPTPKVPVAGSGPSVMGVSVIAGGLLLILLGLAF